MASKRHPLDIFRSTDEGFVSASRERRRKITGKVLGSSARDPSRPARPAQGASSTKSKKSAAAGVGASRSVPRVSPAVFELLRKGGFGLATAGLVALAVFLLHTIVTRADETVPTLSKGEALGPGRQEPAASPMYTVKASQYQGTAQAESIAWDARTQLIERGFRDVLVLGFPDPEQPEIRTRYELVVGVAETPQELQPVLEALVGITDWPGGKPAPFTTAYIVDHPMPEAVTGGP